MSKAKTPSKQSETPLPKNMLKKKRLTKEADKDANDYDTENDNEEEQVSKSKAKSKVNSEKELIKDNDLELVEVKKKEVPNINLTAEPIDNPKLAISGHKILHNAIIIEYYDENGRRRTVNMATVKLPNFSAMLKSYTEKFEMTKSDKNKLLEKWESLNPTVQVLKPSVDGNDVKELWEPKPIGVISDENEKYELNSLNKRFKKIFDDFVKKNEDENIKWMLKTYDFIKRIDYTSNSYKIHVDFKQFFSKNDVPKHIKQTIEGQPIEMIHPQLIFNMYQHAFKHNLALLQGTAEDLFKKHYDSELIDIERRINIINGASIKVNLVDDYLSNATVATYAKSTNLKDLNNVYGFRRESEINKVEGYIKYYLDRNKGRFIYFSYSDIYHLMPFNVAEKFIARVESMCENEESSVRKSVATLKQESLYKKCKLFQQKRIQQSINEDKEDNNDCFFKAIEKLCDGELQYKVQLKFKLRNANIEDQVALVNKSELGFVIAENESKRGILSQIIGSVKDKSIVVFSVSTFKSHTIIVEAGVPFDDDVYTEFQDQEVQATIYDVYYE